MAMLGEVDHQHHLQQSRSPQRKTNTDLGHMRLGSDLSVASRMFLWKAFPGADGQTLAAWFQAVGSIAAIIVGFLVGREQSKTALRAATEQRERRDSIVAVAGAAAEHARRIRDVLEQDDPGRAKMYNVYDKTVIDGIVHALTSAPTRMKSARQMA